MKAPFSFFFVAALMILTSLSACKKEKSTTTTSKAAAPLADAPNKQQNSPIAYVEVDSLLTQYKFCTENKAGLEAKSKQYKCKKPTPISSRRCKAAPSPHANKPRLHNCASRKCSKKPQNWKNNCKSA